MPSPLFIQPFHPNTWFTDAIVLLAGLVAMVLNLILPGEEKSTEEYDIENVMDNAEAGSIHKERSGA